MRAAPTTASDAMTSVRVLPSMTNRPSSTLPRPKLIAHGVGRHLPGDGVGAAVVPHHVAAHGFPARDPAQPAGALPGGGGAPGGALAGRGGRSPGGPGPRGR